jgi:hypothetical protein
LVSVNDGVYFIAWVSGDAWVYGYARVYGDAQIIWCSIIGSRAGTTTCFNAEGAPKVVCGCFYGTLDEFAAKVDKSHPEGNRYGDEYRALIALFRIRAASWKDIDGKDSGDSDD